MFDVIDPRDNRIVAVWRPGIDGPAKPVVYDRKTNRELDHNKVVDTLHSEANVHTLTVAPKSHAVFVYRNESNKVDVFARQFVAAKRKAASALTFPRRSLISIRSQGMESPR